MAIQYIEDRGAALVAGINETTRDYIRTVLRQGVQEGWSPKRVAQEIINRYEEFAIGKPQHHIESRAHGIAVTEVGNAYVHANAIVAQDLSDGGLQMEKRWLDYENGACDLCRMNADAGWIPFDQSFPSGDMQPLAHPYCRCDLLIRRAGSEEDQAGG